MNNDALQIPGRLLSRLGAIAIIVGIVIGAGIFKTPSMVAGITGDIGWMMAIWVAGFIISLAGALCYAELATMYPHAGGDYHFLNKAYGKNISFLYGWAKATVINTGSIALLAFVFGDYMTKVLPLGTYSTVIWAIMIIIVLTGVNLIGIHLSSGIQSVLTLFEVAGLVVIIAVGFGFIGSPLPSVEHAPAFSNAPSIGLLGLALVFVLLTFGGWNESAYISAEVKGGSKAIVSVIVLSIILITVIYLLVNWALIAGLGMDKLASSKAAPADLLAMAFGPLGEKLLGLFVAVAALTSINATMIVGARTNYAIGDDWDGLRFMGQWESKRGSPTLALLVQSAICLALVGFGAFQADGFDAMVEFTAPVFWFFLFLIGIAVFILRAKDRSVKRDFSIPLYPITPLLFCASCAYLSYSSFAYAHSKGAVYISIYVMLLGVIALIFLRAKSERQLSQ
ncbi:amino acid permease [Polynucleobacter sp.]|uniref:APC family permease n=1 Tax=Polynucleobacter sp. TaxID=2029855 RepID=UPI00333ED25E